MLILLTSNKNLFSALFLISFCVHLQGQYDFKLEKKINCTEVKNQSNTGTCWSFATASFLESELIRMGKENVNISEMYIVRNIYKDKAKNYILRQGKANFSQGSLSHDLIRMVDRVGIIPEDAYSGLYNTEQYHDHDEMERGLKGFLDGVKESKTLSKKWMPAFENILDAYLSKVPTQFEYKGKKYTAETFADMLSIDTDAYISITSFTHHPFYDKFILEIPDNYSNGYYYNLPIDELMSIIDYALLAGYSVAWDGDVSEKGFSAKNGIAILPANPYREDLFSNPGEEIIVNQSNRQENFENYNTTDDHLMHIVGMAIDQKGTKYYLTKNSWGEISTYQGFLYMSEHFLRMKTVSIMIHKDAIPKATSKKLNIGI